MLNIFIGYLLGSIPFGLILSNIFGKGNIQTMGSKNIGATNVLRTQGKGLGALTFLLDFLKGFAVYYLLKSENEMVNLAIVAAPIIGHMFPIWLKFKGGKGIATYYGVLCALDPYIFFISIIIWILVFLITKTSSISGLISIFSSCIMFFIKYPMNLDNPNPFHIMIIMSVIIFIKHKDNIKRLINKNEIKI